MDEWLVGWMDGSRLLKSGVYFSRALSWLTGCQRQGRCLTPNPLRKLVSVQTYFHRESDIPPILRKQIVHLTLNPGVYGPKKELKLLEGLGPHIYCIICPMTSFGKLPLGSPNMSKALSSSKNRSNQALYIHSFKMLCCGDGERDGSIQHSARHRAGSRGGCYYDQTISITPVSPWSHLLKKKGNNILLIF